MLVDSQDILSGVNRSTFDAQVIKPSFDQPVLVDVWADRCAPCRALEPVLNRLHTEFSKQWHLAKINAEKDEGLSEELDVRSLPTLMLFVKGRHRDRLQGAITEQAVRSMLAPYTRSQPEVWFQQGSTLLAEGFYTHGLAKLRRAVQAAPQRAEYLAPLIHGLLDISDGEPECLLEAQRLFNSSSSQVQSASEMQQARSRLQLISHSGGKLDELKEKCRRLPSIDNQISLAKAMAASGQFEEALVLLLERMETIPGELRQRYRPAFVELLNTMPDRSAANRLRRHFFSLIKSA